VSRRWFTRLSTVLLLVIAAAAIPRCASPASASMPAYCPTGSGTSGDVLCVRTGTASLASGTLSLTADAAAAPTGCGDNAWVVQTRMTSCQWAPFVVEKRSVPDGTLVGFISFTVTSAVTTLGASGPFWNHTFTYVPDFAVGRVGTIELRTAPECWAACGYAGTVQAPSGPATFTHSAVQVFQTSGTIGSRWTARSDWAFNFYDPDSINQFTLPARLGYPGHRCDDALPGTSVAGCVQASFKPHLPLSRTDYPNYKNHIKVAIMPQGSQPNELTRTTIPALIAENRDTACPPADAAHPRPAGYSCDEYPFATTYQGAFGRAGEGFSLKVNTKFTTIDCKVSWLPTQAQTPFRGYSACMVPALENSIGGGELGEFYRVNRIIDGDPFTVLRR